MLRTFFFAFAASAALLSQPVLAQSRDTENPAAALDVLMGQLKAEPLTAEQQARLPAAQAVVEKIMPPGTMGQAMGSIVETLLGPIMTLSAEPSASDVAAALNLPDESLDLDAQQATEALAILDPVWKERRQREFAVIQDVMDGMMVVLEPRVRKAMVEAYAVHFTAPELTDIDAFFSTPSGMAYARKSLVMASDPRILSVSFEATPDITNSMADLETRIDAATADLPDTPEYADLSTTQRKRLSELTGLDQVTIQEAMMADPDEEAQETDIAIEDVVT